MTRYGLHRVQWLRNGWISIVYRWKDRVAARRVRPGEAVTLAEAAAALRTYPMRLYRLRDCGQLRVVSGRTVMVPWRELMRLKRQATTS